MLDQFAFYFTVNTKTKTQIKFNCEYRNKLYSGFFLQIALTLQFNSHSSTMSIRYPYFHFYIPACHCKCDSLRWSWSNEVIELHGPHMWMKLYNEPGVEFHHKLQHIHPKSCSVMQILCHLNSFILAVGFAIETNVIALPPPSTHAHTHQKYF